MSAPAAWTCPACKAPLRQAHPKHGIYACDACGGLWANNAAALALRAESDGEIVSMSEKLSGNAREGVSVNETGRKCPVCWHRLRASILNGVTIDSCTKHGTWFDRDEIKEIYAARPRPKGGRSSSVGDVAVGVLEVFGAILSSL